MHEIIKFVVISEHNSSMLADFTVVSPCFERFKNSQKHIVVSFVSCFGWNHFTRKVSYKIPSTLTLQSLLSSNLTNSIV